MDYQIMRHYDSNLNQQSFSDWSYSQKFEAIRYSEKLIRENSHQGRRADLEMKQLEDAENRTCVQTGQKLDGIFKRSTSRDRMARRLGISTATLSKYRRIIKLPDDQVKSIAQLLDEKRITFEAAYIISDLRNRDINFLIKAINKYPDKKLDLDKLKKLPSRNLHNNNNTMYPMSKLQIMEALVPINPSV